MVVSSLPADMTVDRSGTIKGDAAWFSLAFSPCVSSAWCSERSTTLAVGHLLPCLSPGFCDSPGGTNCDTPGTQPTGFPWSPSFV